ncbi:MAG: NADP-dependent oxidoreductase [Hyphomicrobiales bacterium]|nr:NADP-dependent oxidoreductase [Hyphomicrobiales bacterium]
MPTNTQVLFKSHPEGLPSADNFEIVQAETPALEDGQFLAENIYLSLDPYMRMLMGGGWTYSGPGMSPGDLMVGRILGRVIETRNADYRQGDHVVGRLGWQTHAISDGTDLDFKVEPKEGVPLSAYLGACGSTGITGWAGVKMVGKAKAGETVLVSAAAGSVGSAAGQVAKALGARAVGIAGGADKCKLVREEFGFDACCDYKADDLAGQIAQACPDGVDVYFDNVGGPVLDAALANLNKRARVPVCGVLSAYNDAGERYGVKNLHLVFDKSLSIQGFLLLDYRDKWAEARAQLEDMIVAGTLKYRETIAEGIDNAPEAFIGMLQGANLGKQLVKLV